MQTLRPRLSLQVFCLCAGVAAALAFIPTQNFAHADDMLTPDVKNALVNQWGTPGGAEVCMRALEAYGDPKTAKEALKVLITGLPANLQQTYKIGAEVLGSEFWRLVAASHAPALIPNCSAAEAAIVAQYGTSQKSLYASAKAYQAKAIYAALAELLKGAPNLATQDIYRGCFDLRPLPLFRAVEKTIGFEQ
jgi:hypothetical protein